MRLEPSANFLLFLFALLSVVLAAPTIDSYPVGGVVAGQTYTITYSPRNQQVSQHTRISVHILTLLFR